jgi:hypothetical protein
VRLADDGRTVSKPLRGCDLVLGIRIRHIMEYFI